MAQIKFNLFDLYQKSSDASVIELGNGVRESSGSTMIQWLNLDKKNYIFPINKSQFYIFNSEDNLGQITIYFFNNDIHQWLEKYDIGYSLSFSYVPGSNYELLTKSEFVIDFPKESDAAWFKLAWT